MKKRALLIALLAGTVVLFIGCGNKTPDATIKNTDKSQEEQNKDTENEEHSQQEQKDNESSDEESVKQLKIYYVNENAEIVSEEVKTDGTDDTMIWNLLTEKGILTTDCKLNTCEIDKENKTISLDANVAFGERIRSMGTTGKDEILTCIVNSYLDTYGCDKLKLTEDGQALDTGDTELDGYLNHF